MERIPPFYTFLLIRASVRCVQPRLSQGELSRDVAGGEPWKREGALESGAFAVCDNRKPSSVFSSVQGREEWDCTDIRETSCNVWGIGERLLLGQSNKQTLIKRNKFYFSVGRNNEKQELLEEVHRRELIGPMDYIAAVSLVTSASFPVNTVPISKIVLRISPILDPKRS